MPARKTTSTSSKSPSSKSASSKPKAISEEKTPPEEEAPKTFGAMKFKSPPTTKVKPPGSEPAEPAKPAEPETEPGAKLLEQNQWVKILSGEFINRVGIAKEVTGDAVTVILQGEKISYSLSEVLGLEMCKSLKMPGNGLHQLDRFYREFHVLMTESLVGGIEGRAINREKDIRLERHYHGVSPEEVSAVMISLVDAVIEEKELDIPPYQPLTSKEEKTTAQINAEITTKYQAEEQARREAQTFEFEALSGVQAGGLIFTAILEFKKVSKIIDVNLAKIPPTERYQRIPSASRVKAIANYVIQYPDSYVLPSITCTIEGEYEFVPIAARSSLGKLILKPGTKLHPIDGGHRLNAIRSIINQVPKLADEEICVKFVIDRGLKHRRQLFSDVNKEQVKPPKAISLDFDRRDREANFHRDVIDEIPLFAKYTERTKGTAGGKGSNNLFVLTWLHGANKLLRPGYTYEVDFNYCVQWWKSVIANTPVLASYDPQDPRSSPEQVRECLCCTALVLKGLAIVGKNVSGRHQENLEGIEKFLTPLSQIDWRKSNPEWEGLIIETVKVKAGERKKILSRNTEQLVEYLKNLLIKF